jgi:hypothetical protein
VRYLPVRHEPKYKQGDRVVVTWGHGWNGDGVIERDCPLGGYYVTLLTGKHKGDLGRFLIFDLVPPGTVVSPEPEPQPEIDPDFKDLF